MELVLILLAAVVLSHMLTPFVKRFSIPIIQIIIGVIICFLPVLSQFNVAEVEFEPDLFFCLFVAPLLFIDAKYAKRKELLKNKWHIISFAFPLVLITVFVLGFTMELLYPAVGIPLFCAFAAALAPTDAVAVSSVKGKAFIPNRILHILEGEALINDASGIVCFRFWTAAALGTALSIGDMTVSFSAMFLFVTLAGIGIGIGITIIKIALSYFMQRKGIENAPLYVLLEIMTPLIIFLVTDSFGASGILAVVVSGIIHSFNPGRANVQDVRKDIISRNTWQMIQFTLNGVIFVLLGVQLPHIITAVQEFPLFSAWDLLIISLAVTLLLYILRFLWSLVVLRNLKESVIISLAGVKGAVTLVTVMTLPTFIVENYPIRESFIFAASAIIIETLLVANLILPLIAKPDKESINNRKHHDLLIETDILHETHRRFAQLYPNLASASAVLADYSSRLQQLHHSIKTTNTLDSSLQIKIINWEKQIIKQSVIAQEIPRNFALRYIKKLNHALKRTCTSRRAMWKLFRLQRRELRYIRKNAPLTLQSMSPDSFIPTSKLQILTHRLLRRRNKEITPTIQNSMNQMISVQKKVDKYVLKRLLQIADSCKVDLTGKKSYHIVPSTLSSIDQEELHFMIDEYELKVDNLERGRERERRNLDEYNNAAIIAFQIERAIIIEKEDDGIINHERKVELLRNVDLLEFVAKGI